MSVLREGFDREEYGEAPPPVLQGVGSGGGGPTAVSGEWPEEDLQLTGLEGASIELLAAQFQVPPQR